MASPRPAFRSTPTWCRAAITPRSAAARELLDRPNRPTAIFAANDKTALGVMDVAQELGLRIPQDLSLVGFDNLPEAAQVHPQLTTVDQSIQEMGYLATKMLVSMLQGEELGSPLCKVPTRLIIRESCQAVGSHE